MSLMAHREFGVDGTAVVTCIGDLDASTATRLASQLRPDDRQGDEPFVFADLVDLRFVPLMTAAGISVLLDAQRRHPFVTLASSMVWRVAETCDAVDDLHLVADGRPPALHHAEFGVSVHDERLRYVYVNDALARVNGLPASAHLGRHPRELFEGADDETIRVLERVLVEGVSEVLHVEGSTPAGPGSWSATYVPVRFPTPDDHDVRAVVATVEPATEERFADLSVTLDFELR